MARRGEKLPLRARAEDEGASRAAASRPLHRSLPLRHPHRADPEHREADQRRADHHREAPRRRGRGQHRDQQRHHDPTEADRDLPLGHRHRPVLPVRVRQRRPQRAQGRRVEEAHDERRGQGDRGRVAVADPESRHRRPGQPEPDRRRASQRIAVREQPGDPTPYRIGELVEPGDQVGDALDRPQVRQDRPEHRVQEPERQQRPVGGPGEAVALEGCAQETLALLPAMATMFDRPPSPRPLAELRAS